jgi:hypothetical protein
VFRARQAQAFIAAGEPDQAAEIAASVIPIAAATGSARMRAELTVLREKMTPWRQDRAGRALDAALAALPRLKGR